MSIPVFVTEYRILVLKTGIDIGVYTERMEDLQQFQYI